jgi:hypothetical protein
MLIRCIRAFGNFVPGDELMVPEGATFDHYYFEPVESGSPVEKSE